MDRLDRRYFLWSGALFIAGCQAPGSRDSLPDVAWPHVGPRPTTGGNEPAPRSEPTPSTATASRNTGSGSPTSPLKRAAWTRSQPSSNINRMGRINQITIHHEGFPKPFTQTSQRASAERLELIRTSHTNRGWADIGYHYIIDRGGRVWEGRPLSYQGAHVRNHNENNIGVMLLGNFDLQHPSQQQVASLQEMVRILRRRHGVSESAIHTHRELGPTSCPGRNLQPQVVAMRDRHLFA